jgi:hypothetical protein
VVVVGKEMDPPLCYFNNLNDDIIWTMTVVVMMTRRVILIVAILLLKNERDSMIWRAMLMVTWSPRSNPPQLLSKDNKMRLLPETIWMILAEKREDGTTTVMRSHLPAKSVDVGMTRVIMMTKKKKILNQGQNGNMTQMMMMMMIPVAAKNA